MVWPYVIVGLVIIIAILILMRVDSSPIKGRFSRKKEIVTDVSYVCLYCGHSYKGSRCPKCGTDRRPIEFGK